MVHPQSCYSVFIFVILQKVDSDSLYHRRKETGIVEFVRYLPQLFLVDDKGLIIGTEVKPVGIIRDKFVDKDRMCDIRTRGSNIVNMYAEVQFCVAEEIIFSCQLVM